MTNMDGTAVERDDLDMKMLAAWLNVNIDQIPASNRAHLNPHTMASWKRVGEAAIAANPATARVAKLELKPIATAPELDRVMVAGWQKRSGNTQGYWWYHEDVVSEGKAIETPHATHWFPIIRPDFPEGPLT